MGQRMQETLYETSMGQQMQETLSDRRSRRHSMGQQMQETLYGTADAGDTL